MFIHCKTNSCKALAAIFFTTSYDQQIVAFVEGKLLAY